MDEYSETLTLFKSPKGAEIIVQHDQSGSSYGIDLSEEAYLQLKGMFLADIREIAFGPGSASERMVEIKELLKLTQPGSHPAP
jgi:hypothetical protein